MGRRPIFAGIVIAIVVGSLLWKASNWWERAFAARVSSEVSPDECIRIDTYEPFWVLPSFFHRIPHPDPTVHNALGMRWDAPIFKRAYEERTGFFLGETVVYDPSAAHNLMFWNVSREPGRRIVLANGFPLVDSDRCADEATLAKLDAYRERRREGTQLMRKSREREGK